MQENKNEFKVGDYVIINDLICKIIEDNEGIIKVETCKSRENSHQEYLIQDIYKGYIQKWIPKEGEWCWFYKKNSKNPVFAKFVRLLDSNIGNFEANGYTPNGTDCEDNLEYGYFYTCEPFIGELPYEA